MRPSPILVLAVLVAAVWGGAALWRERAHAALGAEVAAKARPGDIAMISSQTCVYCTRARQWFTAHQVPFGECFVERDPACAQAYRALNAPGTPVLVVRETRIVGFAPERIAAALE